MQVWVHGDTSLNLLCCSDARKIFSFFLKEELFSSLGASASALPCRRPSWTQTFIAARGILVSRRRRGVFVYRVKKAPPPPENLSEAAEIGAGVAPLP